MLKAKVKHSECGHQIRIRIFRMGDHYVLGFALALRFLQSQILCKGPSHDLVPKGAQEKRTEILENKVDRM